MEAGARISQSMYVDMFLDAGNVYRTHPINPSRLFQGGRHRRGMISPLGPIGLDIGYGIDRTDFGVPKPGWKLHFRLGNFF